MRRLAAAAAAAAGLALGGCSLTGGDDEGTKERVVKTTTTRVEVLESVEGGFDPQALYRKEAQGIVTVYALFGDTGGGTSLGDLLDPDSERDDPGGVGSGFVISGEGEIVTNAHVVTSGSGNATKTASEVYVDFADGNRVPAKVRGYDPHADIALLTIDPDGLEMVPLPLGESKDVRVGSPVAALGSPFGRERSLSIGVVSAVDRDIASLTRFSISGAIQTDAAINPGNSGGPLVNARGEVVGVNQQIETSSGSNSGVGFSVPVDVVKRSIGQLREKGRADYAYLGVSSTELYPQLVEKFNLPVDKGAWIQEVEPGDPAARAGLRGGKGEIRFQIVPYAVGGDIVTKVDDTPIEDSTDLASAISRHSPGDTVDVEIFRGKDRRVIKVKLGRRPVTARR